MEDRQFFIPSVIEDDGAFKTMHITHADVITYRFGSKRMMIYMVPNYSKQVYEDVLHFIWAELSKKARESRCKISDGHGGFITCKADCKSCSKTRCGLPSSLDYEQEVNGHEIVDNSADCIEKKILQMTLEDLFRKLRKINPQYADILEGLYKEMSHHEIGLNLGKSESTIQEQAALALILAKKILSE